MFQKQQADIYRLAYIVEVKNNRIYGNSNLWTGVERENESLKNTRYPCVSVLVTKGLAKAFS